MVRIAKNSIQVILLTFFIQLPVLAEIRWGSVDETIFGYIGHILLWSLLLTGVGWYLHRLRKGNTQQSEKSNKMNYLKVICLVLLSIALQIVLTNLFSNLALDTSSIESIKEQMLSNLGWMTFVTTNVFTPIFEEVVFRGIFQEKLEQDGKALFAILMSSILFAFLHTYSINLNFLLIFMSGLVFSYTYSESRRLSYPIAAHIFTNCLATFLNFL